MKFLTRVASLAIALIVLTTVLPAQTQDCYKTILYNGKIATMDQHNTMATSVTIDGDRITAVGVAHGIPKHTGCAHLIDLKGRTTIPGLIDGHNHIVVASLRPGHDARIEVATSIVEVQQLIRNKAAALTPDDWITAIGG